MMMLGVVLGDYLDLDGNYYCCRLLSEHDVRNVLEVIRDCSAAVIVVRAHRERLRCCPRLVQFASLFPFWLPPLCLLV